MTDFASLVSDNFSAWTSATARKSTAGRGGGKRISLYGIERLRRLILELALSGKLVNQDPKDEPASQLLKQIKDEKAILVASGHMKKSKVLPPIESSERPYPAPTGWMWVRLGEICGFENGDRGKNYPDKSALVESGVPFVNAGHLQNGVVDVNQMTFIPLERYEILSGGKFTDGDILFCLRGSLGKVAVVKDISRGAIASSLVIVRFGSLMGSVFPMLYFDSPLASKMVKRYDNGTAQPNLSSADLSKFVFPLPPLTEQQRIVAKVDELMALCDALETESEAAMAAHQVLVEYALATLTNSTDANDLAANWARIEAHFDTLFTTEASVDALKQTVIELAVRGKLVESDKAVKQGALGQVGDWVGGNGFPKNYQGKVGGEFPFLKVSDMNLPGNERLITTSNNYVSIEDLRAMRAKAHPAGTIIFPKIGGAIATNKRRILSAPAAIDNNCAGQIPKKGIDVDWLYMVLSSIDMAAYQVGTSVPALNMKRLALHAIAIPQEIEQRRIVAKVDELMVLCDALKARITDAAATQKRLADAITERAAA